MPAVLALPAFWGAVSAGVGGGAVIYGATKQASAADNAAQLQSDAAAKTLAFQKQQAETDYQNQEVNRKANYAQFAARDQRIGTLGEAVGLAPRQTPAYVPSIDPLYTGTAAPGQLEAAAASTYGAQTRDGQSLSASPSTAGAAVTGPSPIGGAPLQAPGPMVRLKSPSGQIASVPQSQVMHYLSLGAQYV